jgi:SAM-dependent methyltransferase
MPKIHHAALDGYTARAEIYVTGRPGYPSEVIEWLRSDLGLGKGSAILDLGSGTGKFLPYLRATGARIVAVEPVPAMLAQLLANNEDVEAKPGTAEQIPFDDASMDAVVCAQSFHWFANSRALRELHRVLKPGGVLGLIWNVRDESVGWVAKLSRIMSPYESDAPRHHSGQWRRLFPAAGFGPLRERHFPNSHVGSPEHVIVDRVLSVSFIAALPAAEQDRIASQVREVIATTPALANKENVAFPYQTAVFSCVKEG